MEESDVIILQLFYERHRYPTINEVSGSMMESRSSRANRRNEELPQLSCDACRNRKVKCDKLNPCSNCISLGVACIPVHRLRLPRGRHVRGSGGVSEDLKRRIKRLEALVAHPAIAIKPTEKVGLVYHFLAHQDAFTYY